jgi:branched-chain amino acid transport system substrate-binding protein
MKAVKVKATVVGFPANATDLVGALTAAGAQSADMVAPMIGAASNCISMAKGLEQLQVDPAKVVSLFPCALPQAKNGYTNHDYPKWWYGLAQSGDAFLLTPAGRAYRKILAEYKALQWVNDVLYPGMIGTIFTITQFMNNIGYDKLTPQAIVAQAKKFRGPLFMGQPRVLCGNYPAAPGMCGGGDNFFRYGGNNKWKKYPVWIQVPVELQKQLHAKVIQPQQRP